MEAHLAGFGCRVSPPLQEAKHSMKTLQIIFSRLAEPFTWWDSSVPPKIQQLTSCRALFKIIWIWKSLELDLESLPIEIHLAMVISSSEAWCHFTPEVPGIYVSRQGAFWVRNWGSNVPKYQPVVSFGSLAALILIQQTPVEVPLKWIITLMKQEMTVLWGVP